MSDSRPTPRDMRKRLLRLEAEAYRLEMRSSLQRLRNPLEHLQGGAPALLNLVGAAGGFGAVASFLKGSRFSWAIKAIPLAIAGWRLARRLQELMAARRSG